MTTKREHMKTVYAIQEMHELLDRNNRAGKTVGLVPTMGFLHEGHLMLVEKARAENDIVVMSIFVNPAQFGPGEDFESYPRNAEKDMKLAEEAGVNILFMPSVDEMYPRKSDICILPGGQATSLCGASRPGHFDGVLKVVLKLFNIVDPDFSYFGMKDAQQLAIIETFVEDFNLRTKIVRVQTVREEDGLAKSSRNVNLSPDERAIAPILREALLKGMDMFHNGFPVEEIEKMTGKFITDNSTGTIDYVKILSYPKLLPYDGTSNEAILACAVKFQKTRLIDNIILTERGESNVQNDDEQ